jgi:HlyD family secretion protein
LTVRAPSAGTVTALMTARGAPVDTSTPIATVADLDRLAVSVDLSEFDVAQVRPGLKAVVSVDALGGKSFSGIVLFAAPTGTDNGGVVTFPVRVGLSHARGLRPGMNVSVRITVARRHDVLLVPLEAVTQDGGESTVTVKDDSGGETARTVKLGLTNNKSAQIVKGLHAGERVVLTEAQAPAGEE